METMIRNKSVSDSELIETITKIETAVFEDNTKCGEVLIGPTAEFTFVCVLCQSQYKDIYEFGEHVRDFHFQSVNEVELSDASFYEAESGDLLLGRENKNPKFGIVNARKERKTKIHEVEVPVSIVSEDGSLLAENKHSDICNESQEDEAMFNTITEKKQSKFSFWCKICDHGFMKLSLFETHIKNKHTKKHSKAATDKKSEDPFDEQFICKYCDQPYPNIKAFNEHGEMHSGVNKFTCGYCPKNFFRRTGLQYHINTHTGERPFQCPHCTKAFADSGNLRSHINIHLNIRRFSCDFCSKTFVKSTEKIMHERTHTGEKPYQCEECGKRFLARAELTAHKRRHRDIRNHVCNVCKRAFYSMELLKDHMTMHSNDRPFVCNVCGCTFRRRNCLWTHQQLHSVIKKYACNICGKAYAQYAGLHTHKKLH